MEARGLQCEILHEGDVLVVKLKGVLGESNQTYELGETLRNAETHVVIDMAEVEFVATAGLGVIASTFTNAQKSGTRACCVATSMAIVRVFDITGLSSFIQIFPDVDKAKAYVRGAAAEDTA